MHAVIFDIDGTLLHSVETDEALFTQALRYAIDGVKLRPLYGDYEHVTDAGIVWQVARENAIDDPSHISTVIKSHFLSLLKNHVTDVGPFVALQGARSYLQKYVASSEHEVAIATGGWRESALLKLESAGLGDIDVPIATSNDAMDRVGIMRHALAQLPGEFESITYYGDAEWDQRATAELGWKFIPVGPTLGGLAAYGN